MPDSDELDDILNEIKSLKNGEPNKKKEIDQPNFTIDDSSQPAKTEPEEQPEENVKSEPEKETEEDAEAEPEEKSDGNDYLTFEDFAKPEKNGENYEEDTDMSDSKKSKKKGLIIAIVIVLVIAVAAAVAFAVKNGNKQLDTTAPSVDVSQEETTEPVALSDTNPLTGESDFNLEAVGKRPIACVVENSAASRPQWGINDEENPPDIIVEGEVEGGETRMLWMYADYTAVPSQIGPMRSARPPYIKFSELFDAIFLHWGQSQTKKGTAYIGANTVFRVDEVDHINQMTYSGSVALFGRDSSRGVSTEHTGVLYGDKIAAAIEGEGFRTDADESSYTKFSFADDVKYDTACSSLGLAFSSRTATREWTYSEEDGMYHCNDYGTDVTRKNLLVLFDTTEYISKANYKNSGSAEIYCNYKLEGGSGKIACNGTVTDITWSVENGVIVLKDANGADVSLSTGTTWIGYASSNNGGSVS